MLGFGVLAPTSNDITLTNVAAVPEPASMIALGAGLLALARRRRSK
ncbi:MAG: PEP-CTERM sorting domain-containing protein [Armatimonadota bacterium]